MIVVCRGSGGAEEHTREHQGHADSDAQCQRPRKRNSSLEHLAHHVPWSGLEIVGTISATALHRAAMKKYVPKRPALTPPFSQQLQCRQDLIEGIWNLDQHRRGRKQTQAA